jgi:predicted O-methyltransferase YrrM
LNSYGIKLLKQYDLHKNHKLIQKKSYEALPLLLQKYGEESFDLIFIDGWHTFDYTLIDFFYADKLLKINGIIIIDDALHSGVKKCIDYLNTNYKFYNKIESPITLGAFQKTKNDDREWNFHKNF